MRVGAWAARISWATAQGNGRVIFCLGSMILCAATLAVLLVIGGVETNPGRGVEADSITAVVMLKFKWRRAGNGSVLSVDRRDSDC